MDVSAVYDLIERHVPRPYAGAEAMTLAITQNRNTLSLFTRNSAIVGFHAALFLSARGLERLLAGEFNALDPDTHSLVDQRTVPAAIYIWMVVAPGLAVEGMLQMAETLRRPLFASANLYARPATPEGKRLMLSLGYQPIADFEPSLYRYVRLKNRSGSPQQHAA